MCKCHEISMNARVKSIYCIKGGNSKGSKVEKPKVRLKATGMEEERTKAKEGTLYIVATPIGNLEDITLRAIRILKDVHLIAAEDTRRTKTLLDAHGIATPLTSLYDQIEAKKSGTLIAGLKAGHDLAYVSDAGTPGISDPGFILIREAIAANLSVVPIPGVSAVIAALCVSGLPMHAFAFYAFLPAKAAQRREFLHSVSNETKTLVFYESPHRLTATLSDMKAIFGNRQIAVARELTKLYEEILRGEVDDVLERLQGRTVKGEITIIAAGAPSVLPECSDDDIRSRLATLAESGRLSLRECVDQVVSEQKVSRRRVYQIAIKGEPAGDTS